MLNEWSDRGSGGKRKPASPVAEFMAGVLSALFLIAILIGAASVFLA
jgi:hypothetical protein